MAPLLQIMLALASAALSAAQDGWDARWFDPESGCVGQNAPANCALLDNGMQYVRLNDSFGYVWNPHQPGAQGGFCTPAGVQTSSRVLQDCGRARFQIFCKSQAFVRISGAVQAHDLVANDDSFWIYIDNPNQGYRYWHGRFTTDGWNRVTVPGNAFQLEAGAHDLYVSEREDGARIAHLYLVQGYPTCTIGHPQDANLTAGDVNQRLLALETESNDRISDLESQVSTLTSTLTSELSSTASQISASESRIDGLTSTVADVQSYAAATSSIVQSTISSTASQISASESRINSIATKLSGIGSFDVQPAQSTRLQTPLVEATGPTVAITAGTRGNVIVSGDTCSNADICDMANALKELTAQLRA